MHASIATSLSVPTHLTQVLAVDELRRLQAEWSDLESSAKERDATVEVARYRLHEKERELEKLQVMLEEKGLFVGDLGEQRRRVQDVVGSHELRHAPA